MSASVRPRRGSARLVCALFVLALTGLAGCGSDDDYANEPRPPAPINVTAVVTDDEINLSPRTFGGGPINLIVSNQTDASQQVTLETDELGGSQGGVTKSTGPINPDGTATIKVDVREGEYLVSVEDEAIEPAKVEVGPARPSAQNDLLQP